MNGSASAAKKNKTNKTNDGDKRPLCFFYRTRQLRWPFGSRRVQSPHRRWHRSAPPSSTGSSVVYANEAATSEERFHDGVDWIHGAG